MIENDIEYSVFGKLKITKNEIITFVVSFLVVLIAKGNAVFNIGYATDDYTFALNGDTDFTFFLSQGRFGSVILFVLLRLLGIHSFNSYILSGILTMISLIFAGIIVSRIWSVNNLFLKIIVVLIIGLHPYSVETFTFKVSLFSVYFVYFFTFFSLYLLRKDRRYFTLGVLLFIFVLSCYQIAINYVLPVILMSFVLFLIRNSEKRIMENIKKITKEDFFYQFVGISIAITTYLIINKLILFIFKIPLSSRGSFIDFLDIPNRFTQIIKLFFNIFLKDESFFFPLMTKIIIIITILITFLYLIYYYFYKINSNKDYKGKQVNYFIYLLTVIFLIFLVMVSSILTNLILKDWWPVPRVISSISIFLAGISVIVFTFSNSLIIKRVISVFLVIILFSFVGINNNILTDQLRVNKRDMLKANRLFTRLEIHPDFYKVKKLAVIGGGSFGYTSQIGTVKGDMNISAYGQSWSRSNVIFESTGYYFNSVSPDEMIKVEKYLLTQNIPTETNYVDITDDIGIIVFK